MMELSQEERRHLVSQYRELRKLTSDIITPDEVRSVRRIIENALGSGVEFERDGFGFNPLLRGLTTASALCREVSADRNMVIAILLSRLVSPDNDALEGVEDDVIGLMAGLEKVQSLYRRHSALANENFRNLMLTFAQDIRVIIIMIVDRLCLMREINHHPDEQLVQQIARESAYLYAQLAHRLGLYKIKGELEDMSLKYTNREMFTRIARKLNETKRERDAYMKAFIGPVKKA